MRIQSLPVRRLDDKSPGESWIESCTTLPIPPPLAILPLLLLLVVKMVLNGNGPSKPRTGMNEETVPVAGKDAATPTDNDTMGSTRILAHCCV